MTLPLEQWSTSLRDRIIDAIDLRDASAAIALARHGDGRARDLATEYQLMFRGLGITVRLLASELARRRLMTLEEQCELWSAFFDQFVWESRTAWVDAGPSPVLTGAPFAPARDVDTFLSWAEQSFKVDQAARAAQVCERIEAGDLNAVPALMESKTSASYRPMHDLLVDQMAQVFGRVVHLGGTRGLGDFLMCVAESRRPGVDDWERGGSRGVAEAFTGLLTQHLSDYAVTETDEAYVIEQQLCGSGGRLIRDGAYEGASALPIISGPSELTGDQGALPVYCTHCPVWNTLAPERWYGHPHVLLDDPARADGSCRLLIPKFDTRDE